MATSADLYYLPGGWINFGRPKTGISRRCKLWPETIKAIEAAIAERPTHKEDADEGLCFVTKYGHSWYKNHGIDCPIAKEFAKLVKAENVKGTFYWLRHTFRTIAGAAKDEPAASFIMGHADESMAANYTQMIDESRSQMAVPG